MVQPRVYLGRKLALPLIVFVLTAVPVLVLLVVRQGSRDTRAGVVFTDYNCDVGEICVGREGTDGVFTFVNRRREPVRIDKVISSCACAVAEYTKEPISYGQTGRIVVRVDAKGRTEIGSFERSLGVVFADATLPPVKLAVKGIIVQPLRVIPGAIALGQATHGDFPIVRRVRVVSGRDHAIRLGRFASEKGLIRIGHVERDIPPHGKTTVQIAVVAPPSMGCFRDVLVIETDEPLAKSLHIPVYGWLTDEFIIEPETLRLGFVGQRIHGERSVHIARADGRPFQILRNGWEGIPVQVRFDQAAKCEHILHVQYPGQGVERGEAQGRLILDLATPEGSATQCIIDTTAYVR